jgi:hypothetical protein
MKNLSSIVDDSRAATNCSTGILPCHGVRTSNINKLIFVNLGSFSVMVHSG